MVKGVLVGLKVIVWDVEDSRKLFSKGFYGKPFGIRKPKSSDFKTPLELSLIEALYLVEKGELEVYTDNRRIEYKELLRYCEKYIPRFKILYLVYKDLREKGYIVRSGLKFGCDYAVYELGPGLDHAPYLIHVLNINEKIDPIEIVRAGRLSHSVRKRFIIAATSPRIEEVKYIMFKWFKP